jgi:hypothetical protein
MTADIGRFGALPGVNISEQPADLPEEGQKPTELVYGSVEEFLHRQLLPTFVRTIDGRAGQWCVEWYYHPEAISRLEALWRAWEHLRLDGATGMSVWWKDRADHQMAVLLDPRGPFFRCDMKEHRDYEYIEPRKAPEGLFPDVREQPI